MISACNRLRLLAPAALLALLSCESVGAKHATAQPAPLSVRGDEAPTRRALLIGINAYQALPSLRGALNDVDLMEELLTSRFGFSRKNITRLTDKAATRAGILAALEALAKRTGPGDVVYVHFSGHGSQVGDTGGDETEDKRDETIVPTDGRTAGVADITDDELSRILGTIDGRRVVVVLDSCHSGTATRSAAVQARAVPMDERADLYAAQRTRAVVPLAGSDYVLLTGASADQQALDGPVDGRLHGLFTYALARSLSNSPVGAAPRDVLVGVERELQRIKAQLGLSNMPEPQLEATEALMRDVLFPTPGAAGAAIAPAQDTPRLPSVATRREKNGRVRLIRGLQLGAVIDSVWAIYPPSEMAFPPGRAVAQVRVESIDAPDAVAVFVDDARSIAKGSRAIAVAPPPAAGRVAVSLEDADAARGARIRAAVLAQLDSVDFVARDTFARFSVQNLANRSRVYGADGLHEVATLEIESEAQLAAALTSIFARSITAAELLSLDNPSSGMALELSVSVARPSPGAAQPGRARAVYRIRKAGEARSASNSIQLRARASRACHLTVIDVDSEGSVNLLFPNAISEERKYFPGGFIEANRELRIPDSLERGNAAGFHFDVVPPAGTDTVRAFCAADRELAAALRRLVEPVAGRQSSDRAGVRAALLGDVRSTLTRSVIRGIHVVRDDAPPAGQTAATTPDASASSPAASRPEQPPGPSGDWVATSVTLEVAP